MQLNLLEYNEILSTVILCISYIFMINTIQIFEYNFFLYHFIIIFLTKITNKMNSYNSTKKNIKVNQKLTKHNIHVHYNTFISFGKSMKTT